MSEKVFMTSFAQVAHFLRQILARTRVMVGVDMELGTKTACTASKSQEMASVDLSQRLNTAREELNQAIEDANGEAIIALREEIKRLPVLIETATVTELRTRQQELEVELETNDEAAKLLNQALTVARLELEEAQKTVEPFVERYTRIQMEKSLVENKRQLILGSSRETRAKLFKLTEQMKA